MMKFAITLLILSSFNVWAQDTSEVFSVRHLPSSKTLGKVTVSQCTDQLVAFSELKEFSMKCLVVKKGQEQLKFFTLFNKNKEIATFKGVLEKEKSLKNSVTLDFREEQIEVSF